MSDDESLENHPEYLPWDREKKLTWSNFQGEIEDSEETLARTYSSMHVDWIKEIFQSDDLYKFRIVNIEVTAIFGINKSWVKPLLFNESEDQIRYKLNHEQGHFDLCEEYTRRLRTEIMQFEGAVFECKGDDEETRKIYAHEEVEKILKTIYDPHAKTLGNLQKEYDLDTNHSYIPERQETWDRRFLALRE